MVTHNAEDVERRLARLREEYAPVVETETVALEPPEFEPFAEAASDGYTGGGYAWVVREGPPERSASVPDVGETHPRVLLVVGRDDHGWVPAGGGREDGETYEEAAVREVHEETGIHCEILDCRRVEKTVFTCGGDEIHTLWVFFTAREAGGSIDVQETELNGAAWVHDLPRELHPSIEDDPFG